MTISLVLFYVTGALILGSALGVVMTRNIVYAAFALLTALLGVAGLFVLAFAESLALVQVLVYGGAIVILIALVLTRFRGFEYLSDNPRWPIVAVVAVAIFGLLAASVLLTAVRTTDRQGVALESLGKTLFVQWAVPFEIASLVLLVAIIGAVAVVRNGGGRE